MSWKHDFNFILSSHGFVANRVYDGGGPSADWFGGRGWLGNYYNYNQDRKPIEIYGVFTACQITDVAVTYTAPSGTGVNRIYLAGYRNGSAVFSINFNKEDGVLDNGTYTYLINLIPFFGSSLTVDALVMQYLYTKWGGTHDGIVSSITIAGGGSDTDPFMNHAAPENSGNPDCTLSAHAGDQSIPGSNPIGMRNGEKRQEIKDISLNTPAGEMALVRSYSQNKQSEFQFMGMGWNHNHLTKLVVLSTSKVSVRLAGGGNANFELNTPNHYEGVAGVGGTVD